MFTITRHLPNTDQDITISPQLSNLASTVHCVFQRYTNCSDEIFIKTNVYTVTIVRLTLPRMVTLKVTGGLGGAVVIDAAIGAHARGSRPYTTSPLQRPWTSR